MRLYGQYCYFYPILKCGVRLSNVLFYAFFALTGNYLNKANNPISSNIHKSATANKAIICLRVTFITFYHILFVQKTLRNHSYLYSNICPEQFQISFLSILQTHNQTNIRLSFIGDHMMYIRCTDDPFVTCRDFVEVRYSHNLAATGARYVVFASVLIRICLCVP